MLPDVRYALRALRAAPGFTAVAILTLALGIGATTSIYSVVNAVLLRPLPFGNADRLVRIVENFTSIFPGRPPLQGNVNFQEFLEWRRRATTIGDAAAVSPLGQRMVKTADGTSRLWGAMTSPNAFTLLGARAALGRTLGAADADHPDVVVLSHETWRRVFHADPRAIGAAVALNAPDPMLSSVRLDGRALTIVGVLPDGFEFPTSGPLDFYTPLVIDPAKRSPGVMMFGVLRAGISLEAANSEANIIGPAVRPPRPNARPLSGPRFEVLRVKDQMVQRLRPALRVLLGAVGVVLLIVCANLANLLLARGTARDREIAVRFAIGASRARIVRQLLTECGVLAAIGGALGALVAAAGITLVKSLASVDAPGIFRLGFGTSILPRANEVTVDVQMFALAFTIAAASSLAFGILPALYVSQTDHLHSIASRRAPGPAGSRIRTALVIGQLVLATMLLVSAGLLTRTFLNLSAVDRGYDPSNVVALQLVLPPDYTIPRKIGTIDALLARLRTMPDVVAAGFTRAGLLIGEEITVGTFVPPGRSLEEMRRDTMRPLIRPVSSGYLTAAGVRLLAGRDFDTTDSASSPPSVVITRGVAQRYFESRNPVGEVLDWYVANGPATPMRVVGVVEDLRNTAPDRQAAPEIFVEYRQALMLQQRWSDSVSRQNEMSIGFLSFAIRTRGNPELAMPVVNRTVRDVDANAGIDAIIPLDRLVASSVAQQRFNAVLFSVFAAIAGLLAVVGIYGVLAFAVAQRRQEIGIRIALGAQRRQVLGLVLWNGLILTAVGVALGLASAAATARLLRGLLFGIAPTDPLTFAGVAVLFALVSLVASYVPARRATVVDPIVALRHD